jgi:hypothetical protein
MNPITVICRESANRLARRNGKFFPDAVQEPLNRHPEEAARTRAAVSKAPHMFPPFETLGALRRAPQDDGVVCESNRERTGIK